MSFDLTIPQRLQVYNNQSLRLRARWFSIKELARIEQLKLDAMNEQLIVLELEQNAELDQAMNEYERRLVQI